MELRMQIKTLGFLYGLVRGSTPEGCALPSGKPAFTPRDRSGIFPEALPEQEGVRSEGLLKMFSELSEGSRICPHSALVLRNGRLIAKADWAPFSAEYPHVSHSLAKSVTAMAAGIAVKEKYLSVDEKITDIFPSETPALPDKNMREITVRNLLTMSTGVKFNEAGSLLSTDWVRSYLASETLSEPGVFRYNSMNTYMLSAAICRRTGLSLSEYLSRRLFAPMGISDFFWEKCPSGIEKGGWGLYMSVYDYARLGQLWLDGGIWNGVQLLPREWVKEASSRQIARQDMCRDGYGYQVWLAENNLGVIFSGMFGQLVFICPREKMVIALTAGSTNLFPCGGALAPITAFLSNRNNFSAHPIEHFRYSEAAALRNALSSARFGVPLSTERKSIAAKLRKIFHGEHPAVLPSAAKVLDGTIIDFGKNRAGLLPTLIQVMQGCFGQGIDSVSFSISGESFFMKVTGGGTASIIPLSFGGEAVYTDFRQGGSYRVGTTALFTTDEDDFPVLKIQLCFVETSCTKVLKFLFTDEGVTLKIRESPQLYDALDEVAALAVPDINETLRKTLGAILESDAAGYRIKSFLEPTLEGKFRL